MEKKTSHHNAKAVKTAEPELSMDVTALISDAAYALYEKSGFLHGNDERDWLEAEKFVHSRK